MLTNEQWKSITGEFINSIVRQDEELLQHYTMPLLLLIALRVRTVLAAGQRQKEAKLFPAEARFDYIAKAETSELPHVLNAAFNAWSDADPQRALSKYMNHARYDFSMPAPYTIDGVGATLKIIVDKIDSVERTHTELIRLYTEIVEWLSIYPMYKSPLLDTKVTSHELRQLVIKASNVVKSESSYHNYADYHSGSATLLAELATNHNRYTSDKVRNLVYAQDNSSLAYRLTLITYEIFDLPYADVSLKNSLANSLLSVEIKTSFGLVIGHIPSGQNEWKTGSIIIRDERLIWGEPSTKQPEWAHISVAFSNTNPRTGRAIFIVPQNLLYRSGQDAKIRARVARMGHLQAVISLPSQVESYYASSSLALLILNRDMDRPSEDHVLFMEVENEDLVNDRDHKSEAWIEQVANALQSFHQKGKLTEPIKRATVATYSAVVEAKHDWTPKRYFVTESVQPLDVGLTRTKLSSTLTKLKEAEAAFKEQLGKFNF